MSKKSKSGLVWTDRSLHRNMGLMAPAMDQIIGKVMEYEANEAQNFMRQNAPWTDRTANARQGLFARYVNGGDSGSGRDAGGRFTSGGTRHMIVLYHTMPYGFWLEVKHAGKYQIIMPATAECGRQVMGSLDKAFAMMPHG